MTTTHLVPRTIPTAIDNIISVTELRAGGLSERAITARCRPEGPWRRLLPGIVLTAPGEPTRRQMERAATAYLRGDGVISGVDALVAHGLDLPRPPTVHVLVPARRRVLPPEFLLLERTSRPPDPVWIDGLPYAPPERAALDAARREHDPDLLRDLLTLPVYYGLCTLDQLGDELDAGNQRGSSAVRAELRNIGEQADTGVHGMARQTLTEAPLPPPRWNITVCDRLGKPIGQVDAWWDEVGMGWQLSPADEKPDTRLALTAAGVIVVRTSAHRLRTERRTVILELTSAFSRATIRPRPHVRCEIAETAA
ncbi:type IV toxin-antitoxin system AbiEi family antitoxin domain-containing protein [Prauserella marina]|nr:hypothetical protein [Prauserella marina]